MRIRFIKKTKDTREGATASFANGWSGVLSDEMAKAYIENGKAVKVDMDLKTGEEKKVIKKSKKDKIKEDGEI